jgi:hypothetical protein
MVSIATKSFKNSDYEEDEKDTKVEIDNEAVNKKNTVEISDDKIKQGTLEKDNRYDKPKIPEFTDIMELTDADLEIKNDESVKIKPANDIYYELYRVAKDKARTARKLAFDAYLEVKKIKKTYMLDDSDSDFSNSSESENSEDSEDSDGSVEA